MSESPLARNRAFPVVRKFWIEDGLRLAADILLPYEESEGLKKRKTMKNVAAFSELDLN